MSREKRLRECIGKADICELLLNAFSFPEKTLACALADGSFLNDYLNCLKDIGTCSTATPTTEDTLKAFEEENVDELLTALKQEYSFLYLAPGADKVLVFPYESAFRYKQDGREGTPTLFRSPTTIDVERQMQEAGVLPKNARVEPSDGIANEFEFLMYLYAQQASALEQNNLDEEKFWLSKVDLFLVSHFLKWVPLFMEKTSSYTEFPHYSKLARVALHGVSALVDQDAKYSKIKDSAQ